MCSTNVLELSKFFFLLELCYFLIIAMLIGNFFYYIHVYFILSFSIETDSCVFADTRASRFAWASGMCMNYAFLFCKMTAIKKLRRYC